MQPRIGRSAARANRRHPLFPGVYAHLWADPNPETHHSATYGTKAYANEAPGGQGGAAPTHARISSGSGCQWLAAVLNGQYNYFGVTNHSRALGTFRFIVGRLWYRTLRRRSVRTWLTWDRMTRIQVRWSLPGRIVHLAFASQPLLLSCVTTRGGARCVSCVRYGFAEGVPGNLGSYSNR